MSTGRERSLKIVAVIQARLGSSRLPGKVLLDIQGKPLLLRVVERARKIPKVSKVVVTAPHNERRLHEWCFENKIPLVVGDPMDVLRRYATAARVERADIILRLTGDCPCLDPAISGEVLKAYLREQPVIADNLSPGADGFDTEVFSREVLDKADREARSDYDREHVTPWIYAHSAPRLNLPLPSGPKLSVDTGEDLARVRYVYQTIGKDVFSREAALDALIGYYR